MNTLTINADLGKDTISRHIYGHFSEHLGRCIYGGYWVGEDSPIPNTRGIRNDIVAALKAIRVPNLRWPGGCFADEYHWMDGIGPREDRPTLVNTHWGSVTENNHFGTHEFLDLCEQIGCEPYICGNVGSGEVREMCDWVEYVNAEGRGRMADLRRANGHEKPWGVKFWGVGNENWACGGAMRPEFYADMYRQFCRFCHGYPNAQLYRVACGPCAQDYKWTDVMMANFHHPYFMQGLGLHWYCGFGWQTQTATDFDEAGWAHLMVDAWRMEEFVTRHSAIMDKYDPEGNVALLVDEWGAWHCGEPGVNPAFLYQQNTIRDGVLAAINLDIFNRHCKRVRMANIAQTINVLQAMILTEDERMLLTPTYHVFDLYKVHQDATYLPTDIATENYTVKDLTIPAVSASASRDTAGRINLTLSNSDPTRPVEVVATVRGQDITRVTGRVLAGETMHAHNTFDEPDAIKPERFDDVTRKKNTLTIKLPAHSVAALELS